MYCCYFLGSNWAILPLLLASSLAFCLAGDGDTFEQLQVAYGNFPMENSVHKAPVTIESGEIPYWLSGTP